MATKYAYPTHDVWVLAGVGPAIITNEGPESLIHFGAILPADYGSGPHHHMTNEDSPFYFSGTDNIYTRLINNNVSGITAKGKIVLTEV